MGFDFLQIGRFLSVDPLAAFGGQDSWSPYAAMGNNPGMMVDPDGLISGESHYLPPFSLAEPFGFSSFAIGKGKIDNDIKDIFDAETANQIYWSRVMDDLERLNGEGNGTESGHAGNHDPQNGGTTNTATGEATVYIETDGVGHVYVEVDGTVFSYGRYNGSYSPSSGQFGPYGEGVLLKKEGEDATDFIKERTKKYPTNSYKINVNTSDAYSYFNNRYEGGTPVIDKRGRVKEGRVIDNYTLVGPGGNNCATIVCRGLNAGGANIGVFQSPSSLNLFFFNSNTIKNGYNPGLWGPKR